MTTPYAETPRRIIILGSTGSIGTQTLRAIEGLNAHARSNPRSTPHTPAFQIVGLAGGRNASALFEQAHALGITELALSDPDLNAKAHAPAGVRLRTGPDAAERLIQEVEADLVMAAIVGSAGLPATMAAIERGCTVLLANKETLVAAGELVIAAANRTGARLLPVDSEHSGVWQALASAARHPASAHTAPPPIAPPVTAGPDIARITLTASGGALRDHPIESIASATPEQALAHPNWNMGAKVTIDSASLMNKAFELVEARWLFGVGNDRLAAVIHPQSIIHALVDFVDGSSIAQIGAPSMLTPIQYALTFPARAPGLVAPVSLTDLGRLDFSPPDPRRFPALQLGHEIIDRAGVSGAVVNAANERAIQAFLDRKIPFGRIYELTRAAMEALPGSAPLRDMAEAIEADRAARAWVEHAL
ncbi:MAG: 1-deoxy-D-xylulose-5-phosphate reductoisomerase [Phycisphaerales bacterium]